MSKIFIYLRTVKQKCISPYHSNMLSGRIHQNKSLVWTLLKLFWRVELQLAITWQKIWCGTHTTFSYPLFKVEENYTISSIFIFIFNFLWFSVEWFTCFYVYCLWFLRRKFNILLESGSIHLISTNKRFSLFPK